MSRTKKKMMKKMGRALKPEKRGVVGGRRKKNQNVILEAVRQH